MSTILKFILMAVAWLVFTLATFYTCVKPTCCADGAVTGVTETDSPPAAPPPAAESFALYSTTGAAAATIGSTWPALRDRLKAKYAADPNQTLEVFGNYYESEAKPAGFENMGFARAEDVKKRLLAETDIPADKIRTLARLLPETAPAAGERFSSANFNWSADGAGTNAATGQEEAEVVQLDQDNIKIRFPYDESTENLDQRTETYLQKLATRIKSTGERVNIVGHTDSRGSDSYNMALGSRRAEFVKKRLVRYGAPAGQIKTSSRGEKVPEATNATEQGRRLNRRADITLVRK
ncbi:OmpA family protein [Lewinella sp. 4G2]|uniref:OmpA family protein n=1 Tax=Lewinella sp. 4G2 TaxID=1803372 RepID=UPI0007B46E1E|nr:OmpA family protein [Lewinella sp. 4G2]OAV45513.1 hypothetical protein A3850_013890 [Lewinella sp. 4G2]